jgi:adenylate kinase family enzyme
MILHPEDPRARPGERIQVVGSSGAGKTMLARALASRLGLAHVELDEIHWQANWSPRDTDDMRCAVAAALAIPRFVVDGNYGDVADAIRPRIDTVLWLDYTFALAMRQVVVRTVRRLIVRESLWNGNRECLRLTLSKDSIIFWVIQTHERRAREFPLRFAAPPYDAMTVIRFRNSTQIKRWLARLSVACA